MKYLAFSALGLILFCQPTLSASHEEAVDATVTVLSPVPLVKLTASGSEENGPRHRRSGSFSMQRPPKRGDSPQELAAQVAAALTQHLALRDGPSAPPSSPETVLEDGPQSSGSPTPVSPRKLRFLPKAGSREGGIIFSSLKDVEEEQDEEENS